jgi:hypothetical protein
MGEAPDVPMRPSLSVHFKYPFERLPVNNEPIPPPLGPNFPSKRVSGASLGEGLEKWPCTSFEVLERFKIIEARVQERREVDSRLSNSRFKIAGEGRSKIIRLKVQNLLTNCPLSCST